ncbi:Uncharacterised protein [Klebsiella pneumoniae]|nr:Uncharacterised protein [Klebsiella pneumoniae]
MCRLAIFTNTHVTSLNTFYSTVFMVKHFRCSKTREDRNF